MTQILIPDTNALAAPAVRHAVDALLAALDAAEAVPTMGNTGALVRIDAQRLAGDRRGPRGWKSWPTFTTPADAAGVVFRMLDEGREISAITAVRGALGGTTRR